MEEIMRLKVQIKIFMVFITTKVQRKFLLSTIGNHISDPNLLGYIIFKKLRKTFPKIDILFYMSKENSNWKN